MGEPAELGSGDHLRSDGTTADPGVYRVVGVEAGTVTLLQVTDGDGRRRATGEVDAVAWPAAGLTPAADPDAGFRPLAWLRDRIDGTIWELRMRTGL